MDETYRMLGREHQADLDRHADNWRRAAETRVGRAGPAALATNLVGNLAASIAEFSGRFSLHRASTQRESQEESLLQAYD